MTLFGTRIPMMTSLIFWLLVWEIVGQLELSFLIPPITSIIRAGIGLVQTGSWQSASIITLRSFGYGMALAIVVGVPLGVLMGRFRVVDNIFGLWVNMFVSAPLSALVPILMILFGLGETTVFVTVFLFAVWIIVLDARAGVMQVPTSLVEMGRSYGASRWTIFSKIILLSAMPEILAGIRIGLIRGVKGVVIGQILVLNLLITFFYPGISIGGHLGGLAGGALAAFAILAAERRRSAVLAVAAEHAAGWRWGTASSTWARSSRRRALLRQPGGRIPARLRRCRLRSGAPLFMRWRGSCRTAMCMAGRRCGWDRAVSARQRDSEAPWLGYDIGPGGNLLLLGKGPE